MRNLVVLLTLTGLLSASSFTHAEDAVYPATAAQKERLKNFVRSFPPFDVYVAPLTVEHSALQLGEPRNITNRPRFDGATQFAADGSLMLISLMEDDQIDVRRYLPDTAQIERLTHTPESEFSPRLMSDGKRFTAMRLEAPYVDRIWEYSLEGTVPPELVFRVIGPVGWHTWANDDTALLVLETFPGYLETSKGMQRTFAVANRGSEQVHRIAENVGSCTGMVPDSDIAAYVDTSGETPVLRSLDLSSGEVGKISELPNGGRNPCFAFTPKGDLLMTQGTELWVRPVVSGKLSPWQRVADLASFGFAGPVFVASVNQQGNSIAFVAPHRPQQ